MAHGEAPEAAEGFRGEPRGEPRGEHGGEAEPGTQLSMDAMQFASSHVICGTRDQSSYVKCGKATQRTDQNLDTELAAARSRLDHWPAQPQ